MTDTTNVSPKPFFSGEPFERLVTILIALVTIFAAVAGYLQVDAGARSNEALRDSQMYAIQAVGLKAGGEVQSSAWTDLIRLREELLSLAILAGEFEDPEAAARYEAVIERVTELSPALAPPYFDPSGDEPPNLAALEADTYISEATVLTERFVNAFNISEGWGGKEDAYVIHLTMLAVSLFLFGLSLAITGRVRWLFVAAGAIFTLVTLIWMGGVFLKPVTGLPEEAMTAYARGMGWLHQDRPAEAVEAFSQALAVAPTYTNARAQRGQAYYDLDEDDKAAADFEAALAAGYSDTGALVSLGWIYYLQGRLAEAIRLSELGLDRAPEQSIHYFDLGVKRLVAGDQAGAEAAYAAGIDLATRQVVEARAAGQEPPDSLWFYIDEAVGDLESLYYCLARQDCYGNIPPLDAIADPGLVETQANRLKRKLRNLAVALEYTGQPPGPPPQATISPFEFAEPIYDDEGDWIEETYGDTFTSDAGEVTFYFDYAGMQDGQTVVWKVYYNEVEDPGLRLVEKWSLGPDGEAEFILTYGLLYTFDPGDYWVEMYVDSHLVQEGGFEVVEP